MNVLVLESVGSCIDEDGIVYPMNVDNTPDITSGVDWLDTDEEWNEALSEEDAGLLDDWLLEYNYTVDLDNQPDSSHNYTPEELNDLDSNYTGDKNDD